MSGEVIPLAPRYAGRVPRYTSYPTAASFEDEFPAKEVHARLAQAASRVEEPWSVYVHVPFCRERCGFCACSVVVSPDAGRVSEPYVDRVEREIEMVSERVGDRRRVAQLHWGGGTPTYLSPDLIGRLARAVRSQFEVQVGGEVSIEVDPRVTTPEQFDALAQSGFNRVSLGVQSLDSQVQRNIGRMQSLEATAAVFADARRVGIEDINVDLIYGLPGQTPQTLRETIDRIVELRPDRFAAYGYAHLPASRGNQRGIADESVPDTDARLLMWLTVQQHMAEHGYVPVGMDHYALPTDPLAQAVAEGRLSRNFMGYTVLPSTDMLGFGVTAIGDVAGALMQNHKRLARYYRAVDAGELPVERGVVRSPEDHLRGRIITDLMCSRAVDRRAIEREFDLDGFDAHFVGALPALERMQRDGLVADDGDRLWVTDRGRPFVRSVASCFDARTGETSVAFSKGV